MVGVSLASSLFVTFAAETATRLAVLLGMAGPLVAVVGTWGLICVVMKRGVAHLTSAMISAFAVKAVFFGIYVAVVLKGLGVPALPFVASFTSYFLALYLTEALLLQRLLATRWSN